MNFPLIPVQASTYAEKVDILFYFLTIWSTLTTIGIFVGVLAIGIKFRLDPAKPRLSKALHSPILELTWTIIPLFLFLGVFWWGVVLYKDYLNTPEGALEIDVVGKQWMWKVQHSNGIREVNDLHIPVGRPVELTMSSQDVLHSYYIPAFRVKQDVIPGRYTTLWFEATKVGEYHIFCAEFCGTEHSLMKGTVYAMEPEDYAQWLAGGPKVSPQESGEFLFEQRGCITCHAGNSGARGPELAGVFGSMVDFESGEPALADEQYLLESIMDPTKRIVKGYTPLMPNFVNQLSAEDVNDLIAYIKSLATTDAASE